MGEKGRQEAFGEESGGDTHPSLYGLGHSLHVLNGPQEQGTNQLAALQ